MTDTHDGRRLVAIGCTEGVWIGYRHDSPCKFISLSLTMTYKKSFVAMSRVLHLKKVTQCAVLDDFGLFLVLADKVLLWYPFHS
jgi:RHO1 GDP-GTP exchange protein 1/2